MKICVCADSHGESWFLREMLLRERPEALFFLGDGLAELMSANLSEIWCVRVRGNCDYLTAEDCELVRAGEKNILLTHGHKYGVKQDLLELSLLARERGADVVLYGHTHRADACERDGVLFICPGALRRGEYAVIEEDEKLFDFSFRLL